MFQITKSKATVTQLHNIPCTSLQLKNEINLTQLIEALKSENTYSNYQVPQIQWGIMKAM